jgi:hypothetical protein
MRSRITWLNLVGRGSVLFAIASSAPFIEPHEPRCRSGPMLEPFLRPLLSGASGKSFEIGGFRRC